MYILEDAEEYYDKIKLVIREHLNEVKSSEKHFNSYIEGEERYFRFLDDIKAVSSIFCIGTSHKRHKEDDKTESNDIY